MCCWGLLSMQQLASMRSTRRRPAAVASASQPETGYTTTANTHLPGAAAAQGGLQHAVWQCCARLCVAGGAAAQNRLTAARLQRCAAPSRAAASPAATPAPTAAPAAAPAAIPAAAPAAAVLLMLQQCALAAAHELPCLSH